jgi:hypothetical protein
MTTTKTPAATAPKKPAAPRKTPTAASRRKAQGPVLPEDHTPSEAVAHAIIVESIDLTPSVNRIMNSDLHEAGRMHAITLFRDSLGVPGDPNRDPAVAIEASRKIREGATA